MLHNPLNGQIQSFQGGQKNQALWKIGIITHLNPGRDSIVRAVTLRAAKSFTERPIQFSHPFKLHFNELMDFQKQNAGEKEFHPRRSDHGCQSQCTRHS